MLIPNDNIWTTRIQTIDAILTASAGGRNEAYRAATVCQAGLEPPRICITPNPEYPISGAIATSGYFGVNFLAANQGELIRRCINLDRDQPDKIQALGLAYERTEHGTPLLLECILAIECRVEETWDCGDHRTFLGRLLERRIRDSWRDREPLRFGGAVPPVRARIKEILCRSRLFDLFELSRSLTGRALDIETGTRRLLVAPAPSSDPGRPRQRAPEPPGLCLVGCGWWGQVHGLALKRLGPRVRRFFASRTLEHARDFARQFDGEAVFADLEEALADPRVHAVILALPHQLHAPAARAALAAGKHVLIEKPLALSAEEGSELVRSADESRLCLAVAEQYRLSPLVKAARQVIDRGELGRISLVRAVAVSRHQPAQAWKIARDSMGGGVLLDVGIHYIDVLRYWFGEPDSVWATTPESRSGVIEGEESVVAVLSFPGGPVATLQLSWAAWGPADLPSFQLFGDRGSLQFGYRRPSLTLTHPLSERHWAERARRLLPWRVQEYIGQFLPRTRSRQVRVPTGDLVGSRALIEDFLRAITTGTEPAVPGREGVRDLEVVQAAYQALESRPACR